MPGGPEVRTPPEDARVEVVRKETPFQDYFQVDRYHLRHRKFDGGWTEVMTRECFERGHAAAVLPYDAPNDAVVLIEQFRVGAYAAALEPWLLESVAGIIGPGETAEEVVRREALEEANCTISDLVHIGTILLTPGGSSETLALFCGRTDSAGLGGAQGLGLDEEHEDIRVHVVPADDAFAMIRTGKIYNANAMLPLQWLALNRADLRKRWAP